MKTRIAFIVFTMLLFKMNAQDHFPGGVAGAEAWYIVNHDELNQGTYPNHGIQRIKINPCGVVNNQLFNFNHSIETDKLCFFYNAPLENTTSRNVFFVGEPVDTSTNFSHLTTEWNQELSGLPQFQYAIRNLFNLSNHAAYVNQLESNYQSINNANINFYHWNIYQTDQRIKSYGYDGETSFYIGKEYISSQPKGNYFEGNFPEFISFPFELNANQKNRVESYLALKYGITLEEQNYRNSKNIVFWNVLNYGLFGNRVFGIGQDKVSGLNQLQSESVHQKKYLIASVGALAATNPIKQQMENIADNHFIVFGDNGSPDGLQDPNDFNVRPLRRVWLSQNTGEDAFKINMSFKFSTLSAIQQELSNDPSLKLWMLHDRFVNNQEESDFNSQFVNYYDPIAVDSNYDAFFDKIFFDEDAGIYDQFTFGVGPQMIVQLQPHNDCDDNLVKTDVVITGGRGPYDIIISNTSGYSANFTIYDQTMTFDAYTPDTYTVMVLDSAGNIAETELEIITTQISVDFGPDITLNASQQQVILNAGANVNDPEATYKWYQDGELLEHFEATLEVTQPGEYTVEITGGNHICTDTDTVVVSYNFTGTVTPSPIDCNADDGYLTLNLSGGVPPFTSVITGGALPITQVHLTENYVFNDLAYGQYNITTTDINGEIYQAAFALNDPLEGIEMTVVSQLEAMCEVYLYLDLPAISFVCWPSGGPFYLDGSLGVTNPNVSYEWFMNGVSISNNPVIELIQDTVNYQESNEITLKITNLNTGCFTTETFYLLRSWEIQAAVAGLTSQELEMKNSQDSQGAAIIETKVYPNPSDKSTTFYYDISSSENIEGSVYLFSPTGAIISQQPISGQSRYTLPFSLLTSGVYLICTKTASGEVLTDKIIIR